MSNLLTIEQKRFIIQRLACYDTLGQTVEAFKDEFGMDLSKAHVHCYNPERHAGRDLSQELVDLFHKTRKEFRESTDSVPIANKTYRMRMLNRMAAEAERKGNFVLASSLAEQAAKEMGEAYTNNKKIDHSSTDGSMTPTTIEYHVIYPDGV